MESVYCMQSCKVFSVVPYVSLRHRGPPPPRVNGLQLGSLYLQEKGNTLYNELQKDIKTKLKIQVKVHTRRVRNSVFNTECC